MPPTREGASRGLRREPGFVRPFPFTLFPTPHPQLEPARPAGWAGGGEVGGELCGAHRQWGLLAEPRDSPRKVAKCRQCCNPVRCPREPALGSLRCDRRGQTQSEVVSRSQDWLAASRVAHRPRLPVFCLWLHREKATHTRPLSGDTLGEPGAGVARRKNAKPREERRAKRTQWGLRHLAATTGAQAQTLEGAKLDSLKDQLN